MGKKKTDKIVIGSVIALILVASIGAFVFFGTDLISGKADAFITFRAYDENGDLMQSSNTLSIVGGVPGVEFIDLTVTVQNLGTAPLSCKILSASPQGFDTALDKTTKTLPASGQLAWTSTLIPVAQFEGASPTDFNAEVECSYNTGSDIVALPSKTGSLPLTIQTDASGIDFTITVGQGGTPDEFCGDTVCQVDEDSELCPADCAISAFANFRTTDLSYVSGSAIAFTDSCGSEMTAYGYASGGTTGSSGIISCESYLDAVIMEVPCSYGVCLLGTKTTSSTRKYVCWQGSSTSQVAYKYFLDSDSDASSINTGPISFDSAKENSC